MEVPGAGRPMSALIEMGAPVAVVTSASAELAGDAVRVRLR